MIYERDSDMRAENDVLQTIASAWGVVVKRLPKLSSVDAVLEHAGKPVAFVEVKCRKKQYDTLMIDLSKVTALHTLATMQKACGILAIKWPDRDPVYIDVMRDMEWGVRYGAPYPCNVTISVGGRVDRGGARDLDTCVYIPSEWFVSLSVSPW